MIPYGLPLIYSTIACDAAPSVRLFLLPLSPPPRGSLKDLGEPACGHSSIEARSTARVPLDVSFARPRRAATNCARAVWPNKTRAEPRPDPRDARPSAARQPSAAILGTREASRASACRAARGVASGRTPLRLAPRPRLQRLTAPKCPERKSVDSRPASGQPVNPLNSGCTH